jgi:hypothetical protein
MVSRTRRVTVAVFAREGLIIDDRVPVSARDGRPFEWLASAAGFAEAPDEVWRSGTGSC